MRKNSKPYYLNRTKNEKDRSRVVDFLTSLMMERYGATPDPSMIPEDMYFCEKAGVIVGCLGVIFGKPNTLLPFEEYYYLNSNLLPFRFDREKTVYFTRWASRVTGVGLALWHTASLQARKQNYILGAGVAKPEVIKSFNETLGLLWYPIHGAELDHSKVPIIERDYFLKGAQPLVCFSLISEQVRCFEKISRSLMSQGELIINI